MSVEASAPLLETKTATAGQIMDGSTVIKIPVMRKGLERMTLYMPGVSVINGLHGNGQRERTHGLDARRPLRQRARARRRQR